MAWFRRRPEPSETGLGDLRAAVAELTADLRALRRDVDDLDESFRRFRSRRAKQDAVDLTESEPAPRNGGIDRKLPTIAALRAQGRLPWRT